MKAVREKQLHALDRLGHFLAVLERQTDPFEVEATLCTIMTTAESLYREIHKINAAELSPKVPTQAG